MTAAGEQRRPAPATGAEPHRSDTADEQVEADGTHARAVERGRHDRRVRQEDARALVVLLPSVRRLGLRQLEERIVRALDGRYVATAHRRAADPDVRRLRRALDGPRQPAREQRQAAALLARGELLVAGLHGSVSDRLLREAWDAR